MKGSCTARPVNSQPHLIYSENPKCNMFLTATEKPGFEEEAGLEKEARVGRRRPGWKGALALRPQIRFSYR
jgi:hypothetical protein